MTELHGAAAQVRHGWGGGGGGVSGEGLGKEKITGGANI